MSLFLELKFTGGLGNQLFQYATGRSLAIKYDIPYLLLNPDNYKNDPLGRKFGLTNFRIKGTVIKSEFTKKLLRKGTKLGGLLDALPVFQRIEENGLRLHQFPRSSRPVTSLSGYWQSESYFSQIRPLLLEELSLTGLPPLPAWAGAANTVAVHIRRTDYLVENGFGPLKESYYHDAIDLMRTKLNGPSFVFFSDDIGWCKQQFRDERFRFCEEPDWEKDYLQLYLMSRCAHQIIANSSFSWWGAWLNNNPGKMVIRPERPFTDSSLMYESYYPAEWLSVSN